MHVQPRRLAVSIHAVLLGSGLTLMSLGCQANGPFLRTTADANAETASAKDALLAIGPRTVTVAPGNNVILELAIDHLNRIVTPFRQPSVRTVSSVSTEIDGSVLYVATAEETPATLYITDADDAQTTVALTLAPRRVPPREIRLLVPGLESRRQAAGSSSGVAQSEATLPDIPLIATWRQPQHYINELTQGFRTLALGEVPSGYRKRGGRSGEAIHCGRDVRVSRVTAYDGQPLRFLTAKVGAKGDTPVVLDERQCRLHKQDALAAVALWPSAPVNPGAEATLIIAIDDSREGPPATPKRAGGFR
ncbi:TraK domain-containing protein [Thiorhodovibrio frisius]|uniref:TraK domain-containing protein n=1 Tax=Thiorhodovibrio frisius TaxID=631362 RepID=UPI002B25B7D7|nr:type-F conjugative transfer system secretin TraK [Thiorhodovibrio frisius]WPL23238.1 TraK protein [Thiorhodovibrio frisius]